MDVEAVIDLISLLMYILTTEKLRWVQFINNNYEIIIILIRVDTNFSCNFETKTKKANQFSPWLLTSSF